MVYRVLVLILSSCLVSGCFYASKSYNKAPVQKQGIENYVSATVKDHSNYVVETSTGASNAVSAAATSLSK